MSVQRMDILLVVVPTLKFVQNVRLVDLRLELFQLGWLRLFIVNYLTRHAPVDGSCISLIRLNAVHTPAYIASHNMFGNWVILY